MTGLEHSSRRRLVAISSIFLLSLVALLLWHQSKVEAPNSMYAVSFVEMAGKRFEAEVADTPEKRQVGLSGRAEMQTNAAMLFVFETPDKHCFWMKDMQFSIDMMWLDESGRIIHIEENVRPETYPDNYCPNEPAASVLEVAAGTVSQLGIAEGDRINVENR